MEEYVSPAMVQVAGNGDTSDQSLGIAVLAVLVFIIALAKQN